jgi:hypothetical protein
MVQLSKGSLANGIMFGHFSMLMAQLWAGMSGKKVTNENLSMTTGANSIPLQEIMNTPQKQTETPIHVNAIMKQSKIIKALFLYVSTRP